MPGSVLSPALLHCFDVEIFLPVQVPYSLPVDFLVLCVVVLVKDANTDVTGNGTGAYILFILKTAVVRQHLQVLLLYKELHGLMPRYRLSLRGNCHFPVIIIITKLYLKIILAFL